MKGKERFDVQLTNEERLDGRVSGEVASQDISQGAALVNLGIILNHKVWLYVQHL